MARGPGQGSISKSAQMTLQPPSATWTAWREGQQNVGSFSAHVRACTHTGSGTQQGDSIWVYGLGLAPPLHTSLRGPGDSGGWDGGGGAGEREIVSYYKRPGRAAAPGVIILLMYKSLDTHWQTWCANSTYRYTHHHVIQSARPTVSETPAPRGPKLVTPPCTAPLASLAA